MSPFLNEARTAPRFAQMLGAFASEVSARFGITTDFVLVDDGSADDTAMILADHLSGRWKIIQLSRNFGKEIALFAGVEAAKGDLVLMMDADLQHSLDVGLKLVEAIETDDQVDVVYATRSDRRARGLAQLGLARLFYRLINMRQRFILPKDAGDFRIMRRPVARAFVQMRDKRRFNKGLYAWAGFRQKSISYAPEVRADGVSRWSKLSLISLSLEGFTSFSALPLRIMSGIGLVLALLGLGYGVKIIIEVLFHGIAVPGYPSLMVAFLVLGGFNLALLGLLGEYLWVALSEAKDRPLYIVRDIVESEAGGSIEIAAPDHA